MDNTSSRHLQPTSLEDDKNDIAMARVPQSLREYLLSEMCVMPNPEEMLANVKNHGTRATIAVNLLMNAHFIREAYGPSHPSIKKMMDLHKQLTQERKCPSIPNMSAHPAPKKPLRERKMFRRNPILNPPTRR